MLGPSLLLAAALAAEQDPVAAAAPVPDPNAPMSERTAASPFSIPPVPGSSPEVGVEQHWYGGPGLAADAVAAAIMLAAIGNADESMLYLGATVYVAGGPLNHVGHAHLGRAAASLGVRLGALAIGYVSLRAATSTDRISEGAPESHRGDLAAIAIALFGTAVVIDDVALAHEPAAPRSAPARAWSPGVLVVPGRALASIGGTF